VPLNVNQLSLNRTLTQRLLLPFTCRSGANRRNSRVSVPFAARGPQSPSFVPGPHNELVKPVLPSFGPLRVMALRGFDDRAARTGVILFRLKWRKLCGVWMSRRTQWGKRRSS
jgi:hypothetical protein